MRSMRTAPLTRVHVHHIVHSPSRTTHTLCSPHCLPPRLQVFDLIQARAPQESWDVRTVMEAHRRQVLSGVNLVFSRVMPLETDPRTHPLWRLAEQFGGTCSEACSEATTHVVATHGGTDKVGARAGGRVGEGQGVASRGVRGGARVCLQGLRSVCMCMCLWCCACATTSCRQAVTTCTCTSAPQCVLHACATLRTRAPVDSWLTRCHLYLPLQAMWARDHGKFIVSPAW